MADRRDEDTLLVLKMLITAMVDHDEEVSITLDEQEGGAVFTIRSHPGDVGKLIGKAGRTARSIRLLANTIGMKVRRKYTIQIVEFFKKNELDSLAPNLENRYG